MPDRPAVKLFGPTGAEAPPLWLLTVSFSRSSQNLSFVSELRPDAGKEQMFFEDFMEILTIVKL